MVRLTFRRPFQGREFVEQAWFIASVTILPTALVAIPFGAVIALQLGTPDPRSSAPSPSPARPACWPSSGEASPIVCALLIAGAGGSAICADLGSRKIRDEIDAMEVLGISPVQRLVVPRVLACMLVAVPLNGLVSVVGVAGGYFFNVVLQDGTPGAYLASFSALAQLPDLYAGELKAVIFGLIAAVVASYKGLNAGGGPKGVGDAVNQSVVITFMLLFFVNFVHHGGVLPGRPAEGVLSGRAPTAVMAPARAGSPPGRSAPWTTSASSCRSTSRRWPGRRARCAATRRRCCGCWPRSPSAPARWPSSAARSA